jgi:hypothetical protein
MKKAEIADQVYKLMAADAKRKGLKVDELIDVILKREYKVK